MKIKYLFIDLETYSSVNLKKSGAQKYVNSPDFEILLFGFARDFHSKPKLVDMTQRQLPMYIIDWLLNPKIIKVAHNAYFERIALRKYGIDIPPEQWRCTMAYAAYCGLPLSLDKVGDALSLRVRKDSEGKRLIKYFCEPCKPTVVNGNRVRNMPNNALLRWKHFKRYCVQDVAVEREIFMNLAEYAPPQEEQRVYTLDQRINDNGVKVELQLARNAIKIDKIFRKVITGDIQRITGVNNPNSPQQIKDWLNSKRKHTDYITSLDKNAMNNLLNDNSLTSEQQEVLRLRMNIRKTSVKKYDAMVNCANKDGYVRGLFQYYGAMRTGRWAGRLVQLQNLPRNDFYNNKDIEIARKMVIDNDLEGLMLNYGNVSEILSQLIRSSFIAPKGTIFGVADFSAIEARIIAWLSGEKWRLDVFNTHGLIYEASAAKMFKVPIELCGKGTDYRYKGKNAELALGFGGAVNAMHRMGGRESGLTTDEMRDIVKLWRLENKRIVAFWHNMEDAAIRAIAYKKTSIVKDSYITFSCDNRFLMMHLPSGRSLFYKNAKIIKNKFGGFGIRFEGVNQLNKKWGEIETYGGRLAENATQALARDCLANAMLNLDSHGYTIQMHIHDEVICPLPLETAENDFKKMCDIMSRPIDWAQGLPLKASGFLAKYYKKD